MLLIVVVMIRNVVEMVVALRDGECQSTDMER